MNIKKVKYENSRTYKTVFRTFYDPIIFGVVYNYETQEELYFNKKEKEAMALLNSLSDPADNYRYIFEVISDCAFKHRNMTFKEILKGIRKEINKEYKYALSGVYDKEIRRERIFFVDNDGFYHHSMKEFYWHKAINNGLYAYEIKMGLYPF